MLLLYLIYNLCAIQDFHLENEEIDTRETQGIDYINNEITLPGMKANYNSDESRNKKKGNVDFLTSDESEKELETKKCNPLYLRGYKYEEWMKDSNFLLGFYYNIYGKIPLTGKDLKEILLFQASLDSEIIFLCFHESWAEFYSRYWIESLFCCDIFNGICNEDQRKIEQYFSKANDNDLFIKTFPIGVCVHKIRTINLCSNFLNMLFNFVEMISAKKNIILFSKGNKKKAFSNAQIRKTRKFQMYYHFKEAIKSLEISSIESFLLFFFNLQFFNAQFEIIQFRFGSPFFNPENNGRYCIEQMTSEMCEAFIKEEWKFWIENVVPRLSCYRVEDVFRVHLIDFQISFLGRNDKSSDYFFMFRLFYILLWDHFR